MFADHSKDENYVPVLKQAYVSPEMLMTRLEALIEQHYKEEKYPVFYADKLACGVQKLNEITKQHTQQTVFMLVQNRILLESKRLLALGELPVKFIAYELGFEYPSYFCRFFKKMTGVTPKGWRRGMSDFVENCNYPSYQMI
ncbi:helix-turn-helix domain-containing protein [Pedobacter heparinus]|uniref:helix-turn-helix domain-containing protein n=1 Tax=Pedobacter heparinus TaxID=984 RepID=UPI00292E0D20|nr:helix-turn-helix domain-containing protein [Pedobacter heparinus]